VAYIIPCGARKNSLPALLGNWRRKGLIWRTFFAGFGAKIDEISGAQGKTGNLSPPGKRLVVGVQLC
jgi:hypothetical protein